MDYIFSYPSSLEHYKAQVFLVFCFDKRFRTAVLQFIESQNVQYDPETPAGGAKIFFDPEEENDREYMSRELDKSTALHDAPEVWAFTHHDCGACGGMRRFGNDRDTEFLYHTKGHSQLRQFFKDRFSNKIVRTFFVDEKGIIETTNL